MKKILSRWEIYGALIVLFCTGIFCVTMIRIQKIQPSEGMSKEISIGEHSFLDNDMYNRRLFHTYPFGEDHFLLVYKSEKQLAYAIITDDGIVEKRGEYSLKIADTIQLFDGYIDDGIFQIIYKDGGFVRKSSIEIDTGTTVQEEQIAEGVSDLRVSGNACGYIIDGTVTVVSDKTVRKLAYQNVKNIELTEVDGQYILAVKYDSDANERIESVFFNSELVVNEPHLIKENSKATLIGSLNDIFPIVNGEIVVAAQKDYKFSRTVLRFMVRDGENVSIYQYVMPLLKDAIQIVGYDGKMIQFLSLIDSDYGVNIGLYEYDTQTDNVSVKILTKTTKASITPVLVKKNNQTYLFWTDLTNETKRIYMAGDTQKLVEKSLKLKESDIKNLLIMLILAFVALVVMIIPIGVIYSLIAFVTLIIQLILGNRSRFKPWVSMFATISMTFMNLSMYHYFMTSNPTIYHYIPILSTRILGDILIIAIGVIAYLLSRLFLSKEPSESYVGDISFMLIIGGSMFNYLVVIYYFMDYILTLF